MIHDNLHPVNSNKNSAALFLLQSLGAVADHIWQIHFINWYTKFISTISFIWC
jgi:hypothetical protein